MKSKSNKEKNEKAKYISSSLMNRNITNLENKKYSIKVIFEGEYEGYTMAKDPTYVENSADKIIADYTVVLTKNSTLSGESAKECEAV